MQIESGDRRKNGRRSCEQNMQKLWCKTLLFHVLSRRKRALWCEDCTVMTWKSATELLYFAHLGFELSITCVVWSIFFDKLFPSCKLFCRHFDLISSNAIASLEAIKCCCIIRKISRQYDGKNATGNMAWWRKLQTSNRIAFWIRDQFGPFLISIFELWTFGKCIITVQAPCICLPV